MAKVAVVILNWNGKKLLEQFLPSVVQFSTIEGVDIVVADNASTDDSVTFIKEAYPQINIVQLSENYGYADGYNRALKELEAEYYVLLNSDVEVTHNWIVPVIDFLDKNRDVVAAQPKILAQRKKAFFEYAGASGGFLDKYGYPFCRGRIFSDVEEDRGQYDTVIDIFWASGACLFVRSQDYFESGGLDATFFAHMEEIDLCWRLNSRGKRIVCLPQSTVCHVGGATLTEESPHKTFLNFRNNLLMLYKNLPEKELNRVLRKRKALDYLAAAKYILTGKFANAESIMKAHSEFNEIKLDYCEKRSQNLRKTSTHKILTMYPHSILEDFYLKGKKKFSKLNW